MFEAAGMGVIRELKMPFRELGAGENEKQSRILTILGVNCSYSMIFLD